MLRHLARASDLAPALRQMRFQLDTLRHGTVPVQRHLAVLTDRIGHCLRRLHALVWAALVPAVGDAARVLIVPTAELAALPFAALDDGQQVLSQRHELALAGSLEVAWRGLATAAPAPRQVRAWGDSTRLPQAAAEARKVAASFPHGRAYVGPEATVETLLQQAGRADLLHLACHAEFRSDNPMFSALHLADTALTVEAVERLSLNRATVVLSGCETGLADHAAGDEMFGLVRAFITAGAARVLASLWPVDDAVAAAFMSRLYAAWRGGCGLAQALQRAQEQTRRTHPHPYYWAAFVLHGGW
ncbi:MAG: CHAT domain-containing protein [Rubrivivax sp.]